jgi:hypothetical protein
MAAVIDNSQPGPGNGPGEELLLGEREEAVIAPGQNERWAAHERQQRAAVVLGVVCPDVADQRLPPSAPLHVEQGANEGAVTKPVGVDDQRQFSTNKVSNSPAFARARVSSRPAVKSGSGRPQVQTRAKRLTRSGARAAIARAAQPPIE